MTMLLFLFPFKQKNANRHTFPKIDKTILVKGEYVTTHPLLELCLIAPFGMVAYSWKTFVSTLNEQKDSDDNLIFLPPVTERYARERLNNYFNFVKKNQNNAPMRSGCDDEEETNELMQIIEDLYEEKNSFEPEGQKKKESSCSKQVRDRLHPCSGIERIRNKRS